MKKIILAYSGGLDTSIILKWLLLKGFEVITFTADVGQPAEDFEKVKAKALKTGASKVYIEDLKKEFVEDYILPIFATGAIYENKYLLGTSVARPLMAKKMVEIAEKEGADYIAHGCTGKGNDQVRFELSAYALNKDIKVFAPWRDSEFLKDFEGRQDLLDFAKKHNIEIKNVLADENDKLIVEDEYKSINGHDYSEDANLLHVSHEAGCLEDPTVPYPDDVCQWVVSPENAPDKVTKVKLSFKSGILTKVENLENKKIETKPLEMFLYLNELGATNGIGLLDVVENRYIGIKSRGIYETPGGTILHIAILDLYGITLDKEVFKLNQENALKIANLVYNGYWFSPEMKICQATAKECVKNVTGEVVLKLYKGNATPFFRNSEVSLYDQAMSSMEIAGGFTQEESTGFIKINAVRLKLNK